MWQWTDAVNTVFKIDSLFSYWDWDCERDFPPDHHAFDCCILVFSHILDSSHATMQLLVKIPLFPGLFQLLKMKASFPVTYHKEGEISLCLACTSVGAFLIFRNWLWVCTHHKKKKNLIENIVRAALDLLHPYLLFSVAFLWWAVWQPGLFTAPLGLPTSCCVPAHEKSLGSMAVPLTASLLSPLNAAQFGASSQVLSALSRFSQ